MKYTSLVEHWELLNEFPIVSIAMESVLRREAMWRCARDRYPWQQPRHGSSAAGRAGADAPSHCMTQGTAQGLHWTALRQGDTEPQTARKPLPHTDLSERCVCASQLLCLPTSITSTHTAKSNIQKSPGLLLLHIYIIVCCPVYLPYETLLNYMIKWDCTVGSLPCWEHRQMMLPNWWVNILSSPCCSIACLRLSLFYTIQTDSQRQNKFPPDNFSSSYYSSKVKWYQTGTMLKILAKK